MAEFSGWVYLALALNGLFSGLGSALGSYLATKGLIEKTKQLFDKLKRGKLPK